MYIQKLHTNIIYLREIEINDVSLYNKFMIFFDTDSYVHEISAKDMTFGHGHSFVVVLPHPLSLSLLPVQYLDLEIRNMNAASTLKSNCTGKNGSKLWT